VNRPTFAQEQAEWYERHYRTSYQRNGNERRHYLQQQEQARTANYRIAWKQGEGYLAQWKDGNGWLTVAPARHGHAAAILDAKLNAAQAGRTATCTR
jgi:hypothetical protein